MAPWVRPVAYCEVDRYAQSVLLSNISKGLIPNAPSGMTYEVYTLRHFYQSTSSTVDSHARMSALQDLEKAWTASEPAYSVKQFDLFENVNLSSYSSKMCQESEDMCLASGASLRRLATIAGTDSLAQRRSEQIISETDGFYLPTPQAKEAQRMPTNGKNQSKKGKVFSLSLSQMAKHKLWPTPTARSPTDCPSERARKSPSLDAQVGGSLSPTWVEWLMGYPLEWTDLEDWAMQWFRSKRGRRLKG